MTSVMGIDPGLDGAIAVWTGRKLLVIDVPKVKSRGRGYEVNLPDLITRMRVLSIAFNPIRHIYLERVSARPHDGGASAFKFGSTFGQILAVAATMDAPIVRVTPTQWKRVMGLTTNKEYSRTRAIECFPRYAHYFRRKKDHNRAEAAMLALYGFQKLMRGQ